MLGYVYEIYDKRTEECVYVGHTTSHPLKRWGGHIRKVFTPLGTKGRLAVHRYVAEQGPEHFDLRAREEGLYRDKTDLRKREQVWMDQLNPRCNTNKAYASEEHKREQARLSAARSRRIAWDQTTTEYTCAQRPKDWGPVPLSPKLLGAQTP